MSKIQIQRPYGLTGAALQSFNRGPRTLVGPNREGFFMMRNGDHGYGLYYYDPLENNPDKWNWSGCKSGAGVGAGIGSAGGVWGSIVGGIAGCLIGGLLD